MALNPNQQLRRVGLATCLLICGFLVAHSINAFVAEALFIVPAGSLEPTGNESARTVSYPPTQHAEAIRDSGLFVLPPPTPSSTNLDGLGGTVIRASLGVATKIRLIGVVLGDRRGVFAIVEELSSKRQSLYRLHDQIPDVGEVSEILRDGIVIRLGDQEELLELGLSDKQAAAAANPNVPSIQVPGTPVRKVIDRREVELAMNDLPKLLTQARAVPNMVNGTVNGFRIDYIAPASFYEKIGVRAGDVLRRVNGVDIRDPGTMLNLLQQLKNERVVKLDMVRNSQPSTITYELR